MRANHIQDGSRCGEVGDEMEKLENGVRISTVEVGVGLRSDKEVHG